MDHTYRFYRALCHLMLNEYDKAETLLREELDEMEVKWGKEGVHHLELLYYGIVQYEKKEYRKAIETFDWVLRIYPQFSEAQYYKAFCLPYTERYMEAPELIQEAIANRKKGYTINEDNAIYERYPYQLRNN